MLRRGTYSIVARDDDTGELGVAVQSHWFSVGSVVSWARPGVGAVATQSVAEPAYGPWLLDHIEAGATAAEALRAVLDEDDAAAFRQIAVIGAAGMPAVHTGERCVPYAGHDVGTDFSAQANMMARDGQVWPGMAEAFSRARGPLAARMMAALRAAEAHGGDVRGRQSAALLVVPPEGESWRRSVDLRVDDAPEPLDELTRLLTLQGAYALATEGDDLVARGRPVEAGERYAEAARRVPDSHELLFWAGMSAVAAGDVDGGLAQVRRAIDLQPGWRELLDRLEPEFAPAVDEVRALLADG